jgi:hypothetical protein
MPTAACRRRGRDYGRRAWRRLRGHAACRSFRPRRANPRCRLFHFCDRRCVNRNWTAPRATHSVIQPLASLELRDPWSGIRSSGPAARDRPGISAGVTPDKTTRRTVRRFAVRKFRDRALVDEPLRLNSSHCRMRNPDLAPRLPTTIAIRIHSATFLLSPFACTATLKLCLDRQRECSRSSPRRHASLPRLHLWCWSPTATPSPETFERHSCARLDSAYRLRERGLKRL